MAKLMRALEIEYWHEDKVHIVVKRTDTGLSLYVDGKLVADHDCSERCFNEAPDAHVRLQV